METLKTLDSHTTLYYKNLHNPFFRSPGERGKEERGRKRGGERGREGGAFLIT
jgi:hypothetical protein